MKYKLLTVDDEVINNLIFKRIAERNEEVEQVIEFTAAMEMLNYVKKTIQLGATMPDYVFIDINMPVMNGWQLIDKLNEDYQDDFKKSKIYILSSSINNADMNLAENHPFIAGYIVKPFSSEKLEEVIKEAVNIE